MEIVKPLHGCQGTNTHPVATMVPHQQQDGALHPSSASPAFLTLRTALPLPNPSLFTPGLGTFPFPDESDPSCGDMQQVPVMVSAGLELTFLVAAGIVLRFGFGMRNEKPCTGGFGRC